MVCQPALVRLREPRQSKYRNQPVVIDGIRFDSKREGARYQQLKMMLAVGKISDLKRQVPYELAPAVLINGRVKPALKYVADFTYKESGKVVVEDVKGMLTDVYKIKRHLMLAIHGILIREVKK